jgi:ClpP class serine protease
MKEILYCMERGFLERYLKEKAFAKTEDFKAASDLWGRPIPDPGTDGAVDEIYSVTGDTAHIKIEGPLSLEGPDAWDRFFGYGGASYKTIQAAIERAKNDLVIQRVVFDIDSPGGIISGLDETWQAHKALAAVKPTEVRAGGFCLSGAYWLSAPAHKILANTPTSEFGSIGVLVATYDYSKWEENIGIKEVVITSSNAPDKHPDVSTEHGRDTIKARLDALERIFYSRVSEGRGVTNEHIAGHFGKGGMLVAQDPSAEHEDAIRSGMIDGLATDGATTYEEPAENPSLEGNNTPAQAGTGGSAMTLQEFMAQNPAAKTEVENLVNEAREKAKAEYSARVDRVLPIIQSAEYPANIKTIACNVLAGKEEMAAFTATVAVFDAGKERGKSAAAQGETKELGGALAEAPNLTPAAEKELDAALQAEIDKRKAR